MSKHKVGGTIFAEILLRFFYVLWIEWIFTEEKNVVSIWFHGAADRDWKPVRELPLERF